MLHLTTTFDHGISFEHLVCFVPGLLALRPHTLLLVFINSELEVNIFSAWAWLQTAADFTSTFMVS